MILSSDLTDKQKINEIGKMRRDFQTEQKIETSSSLPRPVFESPSCTQYYNPNKNKTDNLDITHIPDGSILYVKKYIILPKGKRFILISGNENIKLEFDKNNSKDRVIRKGNKIEIATSYSNNTTSYGRISTFKKNKVKIKNIAFYDKTLTIGIFKTFIDEYFDLIIGCPDVM